MGRSSLGWLGAGFALGALVALVVGYITWSGGGPTPCPEWEEEPAKCPEPPVCDGTVVECPPAPACEVAVVECPSPPPCDAAPATCPPPPPCLPADDYPCDGPPGATILPVDREPAETLPAVLDRLTRLEWEAPDNPEIDRTIDGLLDSATMVASVFAGTDPDVGTSYWQRLGPGRRCTLLAIFRSRLIGTFRTLVLDWGDESGRTTIDVSQTASSLGNRASVPATFRVDRRGRSHEVQVVFDMHVSDDAWRLTDIVTDGVSMVESHRSGVGHIWGNAESFDEGYRELIERLRQTAGR